MEFSSIIVSSIGLIGLGLAFVWFSIRWSRTDQVGDRLSTFIVHADEKTRRRSPVLEFRNRELTGSLLRRIFFPTIQKVIRFLGRITPSTAINDLEQQLQAANSPLGLGAREFYGLRIGFAFLGLIFIYFVLIRFGLNTLGIILGLIAFLVFNFLPRIWLLQRIGTRQEDIRSGLPDALDMLSVCAAAGLGFDQALQRVSEYWETPIGIEFDRVVSEMELGVSRQDALRNLAERLSVTELTSFVSLMLQSEQLGMSIADTLQAQSRQMRIERRFLALEKIRKVPIKMLFPMTFLILPAIFAIILGPAVPALIEFFQNF